MPIGDNIELPALLKDSAGMEDEEGLVAPHSRFVGMKHNSLAIIDGGHRLKYDISESLIISFTSSSAVAL